VKNSGWAVRHCSRTASRLLFVAILVSSLAGAAGCVSQMRAQSTRPVRCEPVEAFVRSNSAGYATARMGVLYFAVPNYAVSAEREVTPIYVEELIRSGAFSQVELIPRYVRTDDEAIWWGRHERCDLVMESEILYLLSGSGTMPTQLEIRIQIIDTRTGAVLWDMRQKAFSEPGPDIDLTWHTLSGQPAQKYRALARALAEQLSGFLATGNDSKGKKGGGWYIF
jgi:hypothetical protein